MSKREREGEEIEKEREREKEVGEIMEREGEREIEGERNGVSERFTFHFIKSSRPVLKSWLGN